MRVEATPGPYAHNTQGYTRLAMVRTMRCESERLANRQPESQLGLSAATALMNVECLVQACQYRAWNATPGLAHTARRCR